MKNLTSALSSLRYLAAVGVGVLLAIGLAPAAQQASRFVTIPAGVEGVLDRTGLAWRPAGESVTPCGTLTYAIAPSAMGEAALIRTAMTDLAHLSDRTIIETTEPTTAFMVFKVVDQLRSPEGARGLGVATTTSRWVDGVAVIDHTVIELSREGMGYYTPDFSATGFGWTVLHEAAHAIGVEHLDTTGALMSAVRTHAGTLTDLDRSAIAAAGAACR
jgi:hypothetical protein